jgi:agmatinase
MNNPAPSFLADYDPSGIGALNGNLFGLPFDAEQANLWVIAVPWEVTVSYGAGTAQGPAQILGASPQLDLYDYDYPEGWKRGIYMLPIDASIAAQSHQYRSQAARIIEWLGQGHALGDSPELSAVLVEINQACQAMNHWLERQCLDALAQGKQVAVLGGDHSAPLGYLRALAQVHREFGILHFDAHADLRQAYEGFDYSHASIMFNALEIPQISKLVQVGIRDTCEAEMALVQASKGRVVAFSDPQIKGDRYRGKPWATTCAEIIAHLPHDVYVSFDVDGLDPKLCPNTGTPVPGGLELAETFFLLRELVHSGRRIIGFDVCETGDGEWDGNVAARITYKLSNLMHLSQDREFSK